MIERPGTSTGSGQLRLWVEVRPDEPQHPARMGKRLELSTGLWPRKGPTPQVVNSARNIPESSVGGLELARLAVNLTMENVDRAVPVCDEHHRGAAYVVVHDA